MSRKKPFALTQPMALVGQSAPPMNIKRVKIDPDPPSYATFSPRNKRNTVWGRGPEHLRLTAPRRPSDGPGDPPPNFVRGTTSAWEWDIWYWLFIIFDEEGDPHDLDTYDFSPSLSFFYQVNYLGGRREPGGGVPDFLIPRSPYGRRSLILRAQSERYHVYTTARIQFHDLIQKAGLAGRFGEVVDIYEQHMRKDRVRRRGAAPRVLTDALQGISWVGPLYGDTPFRVRV